MPLCARMRREIRKRDEYDFRRGINVREQKKGTRVTL